MLALITFHSNVNTIVWSEILWSEGKKHIICLACYIKLGKKSFADWQMERETFSSGAEKVSLSAVVKQCIGQPCSLNAEALMFLLNLHLDKIVLCPSSNNVSLQPNNDILSVVGNCSICVQKNTVSVIRLESFVANIFESHIALPLFSANTGLFYHLADCCFVLRLH